MDCDFSNQDITCARCGFQASTRHIRIDCDAPVTIKQAVDAIARQHAETPPALSASSAAVQFPGPGAELHRLLGKFGLTASSDCKCNSRAAYMDQMGCDWCEANIEEIVGWLRESAAERGLPFVDIAGRVLIRRAIVNARRKEQARAKEAQAEGGATAG